MKLRLRKRGFPILLDFQLKDKVVFDGRNCFDQKSMDDAGLIYRSVGRQGKKHDAHEHFGLLNPARKECIL